MDLNHTKVKDAVIAVTYRCNMHCRMCNIWQIKNFQDEMCPEDYLKLPESLEEINLTGGEPFLRNDLPQIVKNIVRRIPNVRIIISTNGFATDTILNSAEEIIKLAPDVEIAVSIDGMEGSEDSIRGVKGAYAHAISTVEGLRKLGVKNLKLAFTLGDYNIGELRKVYRLAREMKLEFSLALVHSGENYFHKENPFNNKEKAIEELGWLIKEELSSLNMKQWGRAYFAYGISEFLKTGKRILPDYSGSLNIFIDPQGKIYSNNVSNMKIGQVAENKIIREFGERNENWMMCTARQAIKKHWVKAGWWVIKNKILMIVNNL